MDSKKVRASLRQIGKIYSGILDDESRSIVIPSAEQTVVVSREKYDHDKRNAPRGIVPTSWGYSIDHNQPLRFVRSIARSLRFQVDVYCDIRWKDDDIPVKQDIKVRIWSEHNDLIFRPELDSERLLNSSPTQPGNTLAGLFRGFILIASTALEKSIRHLSRHQSTTYN